MHITYQTQQQQKQQEINNRNTTENQDLQQTVPVQTD